MKFVSAFILCIMLGAGTNSLEITVSGIEKHVNLQNVARLFAENVVSNVLPLVDVTKFQPRDNNTLFLPIVGKGSLPSSLPFLDLTIPIPDNIFLTGHYGHGGTGFQGLDTLEMTVGVKFVMPLVIELSASADELAIRGSSYNMNLDLNMTTLVGLLVPELVDFFPPNLKVGGIGDYELVALKPHFNMVADVILRGDRPYIRTQSVKLGFEGVKIFYRGLQLGGVDFDWGVINFDDVNNLLMQLIHALEPVLPAGFDFVFQFVIANCSIIELLALLGGDLSCIGLGVLPATAREAAIFGL